MSPAVQAYQDEILNGALAALVAKSKEIGGIVEQHVRPPYIRLMKVKKGALMR